MLPNPERRWIPDAKLRDFLLAGSTPKSSSRLAFFRSYGFEPNHWRELGDALHRHLDTAAITLVRQDGYGMTYAALGPLETPSGRSAAVEVFWIIRRDDDRPQLTSAVPKGPWMTTPSPR